MRKLCLLMIVVVLLITIMGCRENNDDQSKIFYSFQQTANGEYLDLKPISEFAKELKAEHKIGLYPTAASVFTADSNDTPAEFEFLGEKYRYTKSRFTNSKTRSTDYDQIFDEYVSVDGKTRIEVIRHNGSVTRFAKRTSNIDNLAGDKEKLQKMAEEFILNILTKEEFSDYCLGTVKTPDKLFAYYHFMYYRKLQGVGTDETIAVGITADGTVVQYIASNLKKFNDANKRVTKEQMDKVAEELLVEAQKAYPNAKGSGYTVTTNTSGGIYINLPVFIDNGTDKCCVSLYAKAG